jgi:hypothetical protein
MPKSNQTLDRVYLQYNTKTREFYVAVDGSFTGVALAIAHAMNTNEQFLQAVKLANTIRGMPLGRV